MYHHSSCRLKMTKKRAQLLGLVCLYECSNHGNLHMGRWVKVAQRSRRWKKEANALARESPTVLVGRWAVVCPGAGSGHYCCCERRMNEVVALCQNSRRKLQWKETKEVSVRSRSRRQTCQSKAREPPERVVGRVCCCPASALRSEHSRVARKKGNRHTQNAVLGVDQATR